MVLRSRAAFKRPVQKVVSGWSEHRASKGERFTSTRPISRALNWHDTAQRADLAVYLSDMIKRSCAAD
jgi:hypothetical protein